MLFTELITELYFQQLGLDSFVLPTVILNNSDVDEIIQCLKFFIKEHKYVFSKNRDVNYKFVKYTNLKINPKLDNNYSITKVSLIIDEIVDILSSNDFKDAHLDSNQESIAFTFLIKNISKRCRNLTFNQNKDIYFKFSFSYYKSKVKQQAFNKKTFITHSMLPKNGHVYIMPKHSFLDIISLHYSRI